MSRVDTWMPLYVGDYLADTMHLTTMQHGAYMLLLMHQWRSGILPDDDVQLAAISRCDLATWRKTISPVIRKFFDVLPDGLSQKRLAAERIQAADITDKRAEAGRAGAKSRWKKGNGKSRAKPDDDDSGSGGNGSDEPIANAIANASDVPLAAAMPTDRQNDGPSHLQQQVSKSSELRSGVEPPFDAKAELWRDGLAIVQRLTGKPSGAARSLVGRWLKPMHDDCAGLLAILRTAERDRPIDPVPWITAAVEARTNAKPGAMDRLRADWNLPGLQWHPEPTERLQ